MEAEEKKVFTPNITMAIIANLWPIYLFLLLFLLPILLISLILTRGISLLAVIFVSPMIIYYVILRAHRYELKQDGIEVKKGVIARSVTLIPYSQVQDVRVFQSIVQRIFGISKVQVLSMYQRGAVFLINLDSKDAEAIKNSLLKRVHRDPQLKILPKEI